MKHPLQRLQCYSVSEIQSCAAMIYRGIDRHRVSWTLSFSYISDYTVKLTIIELELQLHRILEFLLFSSVHSLFWKHSYELCFEIISTCASNQLLRQWVVSLIPEWLNCKLFLYGIIRKTAENSLHIAFWGTSKFLGFLSVVPFMLYLSGCIAKKK